MIARIPQRPVKSFVAAGPRAGRFACSHACILKEHVPADHTDGHRKVAFYPHQSA